MYASDQPLRRLIIGPAWVGDMVMAHSLFQALYIADPDSPIDLVAPPWSAHVASRMPEIDNFFPLDIPHGRLGLIERCRLAAVLRDQPYSAAYVLPNSWKSALIPYLAKIPKRIGWRGEWRWGLLNDCRVLDKSSLPLMVQRFVALAEASGSSVPEEVPSPRLQVDPENQSVLGDYFQILDRPMIGLCPGAEYGSAKRWPAEHFAELANDMMSKGWQVCLLGSEKERSIADAIVQHCQTPCIDTVGQTSLPDVIDLLGLCDAVVSNDSGLMHIAAAVGAPLVAVYGSSTPTFTPPLTREKRILSLDLDCRPCMQRECPLGHTLCLTDLKPQRVFDALTQMVSVV